MKSSAVRGSLWMLLSACCYVASATLLRRIGDGYSAYELTFLRSIIAVILLAPLFLRNERMQIWPERGFMLLLTAALSYLGILFWFTAAARLPVADFFALQFTTPLITIVLAVLFLRERADPKSWAATLVGFAGVLIVLRPGLIAFTFGAFAVLVSSAAYASVNTVIKSLSRTVSVTGIVFYANLLLIPISLPMAIIEWRTPEPAVDRHTQCQRGGRSTAAAQHIADAGVDFCFSRNDSISYELHAMLAGP